MTRSKTHAVVLRKIDYSETSQVVRFYSRDAGKVTAIAKGSKREKSAFHGPFDLFTVYELVRIEKDEGQLDIITQAQVVRDFLNLRTDLRRYAAASYAAEFVDEMTVEVQQNAGLYELLIDTLADLNAGRAVDRAVFRFEAHALRILGHFPRLLECGTCRRKVAQLEAYFSPRDGGAICPLCKPKDPGFILVRTKTLYAINALLTEDPHTNKVYDEVREEIRRLFDSHIRFIAERSFKSAPLMREAVLGPGQ